MREWMLSALALLGSGTAAQERPAYAIKGQAFEACECEATCPCVWTRDATFGECRGTVAWTVTEGTYGTTDLEGLVFALTITKSAKNMVKSAGHWEGVLYVSDRATPEQRAAVEGFVKSKWNTSFAKLETKSVPLTTRIEGEHRELAMGKLSTIKVSALKNPDGTTPVIEHPPFSLYPRLTCAKADVHTYDDGVRWDFAGRNAFYGPFDYSSR